jgi:hypothetical protein
MQRGTSTWRFVPTNFLKPGLPLKLTAESRPEFDTREGAETSAIELKRRFPALQIRVYAAQTNSRHEIQA